MTPEKTPETLRPSRKLLHRRLIDCNGYLREDGLWDLEVILNDTKTYSFPNEYRQTIAAGEPLHGMFLRVAVDINLVIHEVEVRMEHTPYQNCADIESRYQQLVGATIKPGFNRKVKELFRAENGCTHINEMWSIIGTLAFQTTFPARYRSSSDQVVTGMVGMCHMHANLDKVRKNTGEYNQVHHEPAS